MNGRTTFLPGSKQIYPPLYSYLLYICIYYVSIWPGAITSLPVWNLHSRPRGWRIEANTGAQLKTTFLKSSVHHSTIVPRGLRGHLIIQRPVSRRKLRRFIGKFSVADFTVNFMIVVTVFLSILNLMDFHLVQKVERKTVTTIISHSI